MRHFGFLGNRVRQAKLAQCRALLAHANAPRALAAAMDLKTPEVPRAEPGAVCPGCQHGQMQEIKTANQPPAVCDLPVPAPGLDASERTSEGRRPHACPRPQARAP